jgi:hypothetical protein
VHSRRIIHLVATSLIVLGGAWIGYLCGSMLLRGGFTPWVSLGSPPEAAAEILGGGSRSCPGGAVYLGRETYLYVESIAGRIWYCCVEQRNSWQEVKRSQVEEVVDYCGSSSDEPGPSPPPGVVDSLSIRWCGEWDWGQANYVVRDDGTVWMWRRFGRFPDWIVPVCGGPVVGGMLGLLVSVTVLRRPMQAVCACLFRTVRLTNRSRPRGCDCD